MQMFDYLAIGIGSIGVAVIIWGSIVSILELGGVELKRFAGQNLSDKRESIRHSFGIYLLMGLEYMIGGDIIRTVLRPTLQELAVLGSLVAIRTVTSYFLNKEMQSNRGGA